MNASLSEMLARYHWHQRWEIEPGVFTPGGNPVASVMEWADVPSDLSGKRVLDIGAWNGCFSFECERRGAGQVLAIGPEAPDATGFAELKEYLHSKVEYRLGSVYHLDPDEIGTFDVILCFGVIYHLRYVLLAFDMMRRVCIGDLFVESAAIDEHLVIDGTQASLASLNPVLEKIALLQFFRFGELNDDPSNWFAPNKAALAGFLCSSGFDPLQISLHHDRIAARARIIQGEPEWLKIRTGEGVFYDTITRPVLGRRDVYT